MFAEKKLSRVQLALVTLTNMLLPTVFIAGAYVASMVALGRWDVPAKVTLVSQIVGASGATVIALLVLFDQTRDWRKGSAELLIPWLFMAGIAVAGVFFENLRTAGLWTTPALMVLCAMEYAELVPTFGRFFMREVQKPRL